MADRWEELEKRCQNCRECSLCETRTNVVFGDGSRTAEIMFVGEAKQKLKSAIFCFFSHSFSEK